MDALRSKEVHHGKERKEGLKKQKQKEKIRIKKFPQKARTPIGLGFFVSLKSFNRRVNKAY
jgi:hypothetical protein